MNSYRHLVVVDLSSYGSALALINQFSDDLDVKVFEISPLGSAALLILMTKESMAAEVLKNEIIAYRSAAIIKIAVIKDAHEELLKTYLSQNNPGLKNEMIVLESPYVSDAMLAADQLLKKSISLDDFRVVRTFPSNSILVASHSELNHLVEFGNQNSNLKSTLISNVGASLRSYFEVVK